MKMKQVRILEHPMVFHYQPGTGENPDLRWQVRCHHSTMGEVGLCYVIESDAREAAKFIEEFGCTPPTPLERERRAELETIAGQRPVITACLECGDSAPESGFICDGCREDALGN